MDIGESAGRERETRQKEGNKEKATRETCEGRALAKSSMEKEAGTKALLNLLSRLSPPPIIKFFSLDFVTVSSVFLLSLSFCSLSLSFSSLLFSRFSFTRLSQTRSFSLLFSPSPFLPCLSLTFHFMNGHRYPTLQLFLSRTRSCPCSRHVPAIFLRTRETRTKMTRTKMTKKKLDGEARPFMSLDLSYLLAALYNTHTHHLPALLLVCFLHFPAEQKYSEFEQRAVSAEAKLTAKSKHVTAIEEALKKAQQDLAGSRKALHDSESLVVTRNNELSESRVSLKACRRRDAKFR